MRAEGWVGAPFLPGGAVLRRLHRVVLAARERPPPTRAVNVDPLTTTERHLSAEQKANETEDCV